MLNLQRTIIFVVLFAAVWVQSTKAMMEPVPPVTEYQKIEIGYLEESLKLAKDNMKYKNETPEGEINHFKAWKCWPDIPEHEKVRIVNIYKYELDNLEMNMRYFVEFVDKYRAGRAAFVALDHFVNQQLKTIKKHCGDHLDIVMEVEKVVNSGHYLDLLAFYYTKSRKISEYLKYRKDNPFVQTDVASTSK